MTPIEYWIILDKDDQRVSGYRNEHGLFGSEAAARKYIKTSIKTYREKGISPYTSNQSTRDYYLAEANKLENDVRIFKAQLVAVEEIKI